MVIREKKSIINKRYSRLTIEEYNYKDIIDVENKFSLSDTPYIDRVLRKRLKHITFTMDNHPRSRLIYGMATQIFFEYVKIVIEELLNGNRITINRIGDLYLRTRSHSTKYKGYKRDKRRSKLKGLYTGIEVEWKMLYSKFRYGQPYFAFGPAIKKLIRYNEDNGIKY